MSSWKALALNQFFEFDVYHSIATQLLINSSFLNFLVRPDEILFASLCISLKDRRMEIERLMGVGERPVALDLASSLLVHFMAM